jgi:protein gp37
VGAYTKIEWCDHTFNPWIGCQKVSPACDNCYAEGWAKRSGLVEFGPGKERRRTSKSTWRQPLKWNADARKQGIRRRVFCGSLCDVFDNAVPDEWRADLFRLIHETPHLDWLLLTKRIGNAKDRAILEVLPASRCGTTWKHVWLGITVCNQEEADRDIPKLLKTPAAKRFLSIEPMLGKMNIVPWISMNTVIGSYSDTQYINWVICGGESGHKARPMHPEWVRSLRDQCAAADVPFFFKQHGEWLPTAFCDGKQVSLPYRRIANITLDGEIKKRAWVDFPPPEETTFVGKKAAGCLLDGREHKEFPQ